MRKGVHSTFLWVCLNIKRFNVTKRWQERREGITSNLATHGTWSYPSSLKLLTCTFYAGFSSTTSRRSGYFYPQRPLRCLFNHSSSLQLTHGWLVPVLLVTSDPEFSCRISIYRSSPTSSMLCSCHKLPVVACISACKTLKINHARNFPTVIVKLQQNCTITAHPFIMRQCSESTDHIHTH